MNGDEDDLLSFWNYEEPNESTALDLSVNNYIGIISGAIYSNSVSEQICDTSCCNYVPEGEACAGCTDPNACNYNPTAVNDDGSCLTIYGCTDPNACPDSYNPNAQCDDGSCTYLTTWYIDNDGDGLGFDGLGIFSIESCDEMEGYADNNDDENDGDFDNDGISGTEFNGDDCDDTDASIGIAETGYDCAGNCLQDEDNDGVCDDFEIEGCTDASACNYNDLATDNDESCTYLDGICDICDNGILIDNDSDDDGVCNDDEIPGCTDLNACNYNSVATDEDGSCIYVDGVCETCEEGTIIDNDTDNDGVCDQDEIEGCTDEVACNYYELATDDDESCIS